jgi:Flp pilus assembly protein TadB
VAEAGVGGHAWRTPVENSGVFLEALIETSEVAREQEAHRLKTRATSAGGISGAVIGSAFPKP